VPWCCWVSPSERTHSPSRPASSHPREAFLLLSPSLAHLCPRAISTEARLRLRLRLRLRRPAHVLPCPCSQSSTTTPTRLPPSLRSQGPSARSQPATPTRYPSLSTLARRATSLDDRRRDSCSTHSHPSIQLFVDCISGMCLFGPSIVCWNADRLGTGMPAARRLCLWPPRACRHVSTRPDADRLRSLAFRGRLDISCVFAPTRQSPAFRVRSLADPAF
jgi:hypothetical protein